MPYLLDGEQPTMFAHLVLPVDASSMHVSRVAFEATRGQGLMQAGRHHYSRRRVLSISRTYVRLPSMTTYCTRCEERVKADRWIDGSKQYKDASGHPRPQMGSKRTLVWADRLALGNISVSTMEASWRRTDRYG